MTGRDDKMSSVLVLALAQDGRTAPLRTLAARLPVVRRGRPKRSAVGPTGWDMCVRGKIRPLGTVEEGRGGGEGWQGTVGEDRDC